MNDIENSIKRLSDSISVLQRQQSDIKNALSHLSAELAEFKSQAIYKNMILAGCG